jgi:hypothetical protein
MKRDEDDPTRVEEDAKFIREERCSEEPECETGSQAAPSVTGFRAENDGTEGST